MKIATPRRCVVQTYRNNSHLSKRDHYSDDIHPESTGMYQQGIIILYNKRIRGFIIITRFRVSESETYNTRLRLILENFYLRTAQQ